MQSIFRLRDNSEAVGVRKQSINDLAVVEESKTVELDDEDGVLGTGVESKSTHALSPGYSLLRSPIGSMLLVSNNSTSESVSSILLSSASPLTICETKSPLSAISSRLFFFNSQK